MACQTTTGEEAAAAARKQGAYGDAQLHPHPQESPYTDFKNTEEYVKEGYGGEGYEPKVAPKDRQPDYYSAEPTPPASKGHEGGGMKEKIIEKLAPCLGHSSGPASHDDVDAALPSPPKKSLVEKVKEKISPHH